MLTSRRDADNGANGPKGRLRDRQLRVGSGLERTSDKQTLAYVRLSATSQCLQMGQSRRLTTLAIPTRTCILCAWKTRALVARD